MPQGLILGSLLFLVHINDSPKATEHKTISILFADHTSTLIKNPNNIQFQSELNIVFGQLNEWFKVNMLSFTSDKTYFIQFTNEITCTSDIQFTYEDKHICTDIETKFVGLFINNNLSWKTHIE